MRRRVTVWYSQADSERACSFRARWADYLNSKLENRPFVQVADTVRKVEGETAGVG